MEDIYVKMLVEEREKLGVPIRDLCEGICSEDMYYLLENDKCSVDRITIKRLLARLGIDNADYEHYLEYPDYDVWQKRMKIINLIEDGMLEEAEQLLDEYSIYEEKSLNTSREGIESQFCVFMRLQIMRHRDIEEYEKNALDLYEQAVKQTVPSVDEKPLERLVLSPLEFNLVLEYKRRCSVYDTIEKTRDLYSGMLAYIENSPYGKIMCVKVYPKVVVSLYNDMKKIEHLSKIQFYDIYEQLLKYCDNALDYLKERNFLFYMTELLEMKIDILTALKKYTMTPSTKERYLVMLSEAECQQKALMLKYNESGTSAYMEDEGYFYRESAIYCVGDVLKARRNMKKWSRKEMCEMICSERTLMREENRKGSMVRGIFRSLFNKVNIYPDYINLGIVTDKKEAVGLYEELRYARNSYRIEDAKKMIVELEMMLSEYNHPINKQILIKLKSGNRWRYKEITTEEYLNYLKEAFEQTISIDEVWQAKNAKVDIFLTVEEITIWYLISVTYKRLGKIEQAYEYIKILWDYCLQMESQGIEDGIIGVYELIMTYVASLLGDLERYEESNEVSNKLIKLNLKLRRNCVIHHNIYNIAWNYRNGISKSDFDYSGELYNCVIFSQLAMDINDELFYRDKLSES